MKASIPYGRDILAFDLPDGRLIFDGRMPETQGLADLPSTLRARLDAPDGCPPLKEMLKSSDRVLILIEDATRSTPVSDILPVLLDYLGQAGIPLSQIELLTAPGTHRMLTEAELREKVGADLFGKLKISQHDYQDESALLTLDPIEVAGVRIPLQVNRKAAECDFIIGLGNIIPHSDAGFSGGAKILQPGICGYPTTAATHIAAALLEEIPLGVVDNPCRLGMEQAARRAGLKFIVNTVKNARGEVIEVVAGDLVAAHRRGAAIAKQAYATPIPALADIVIASSHPADMDFWQAGKGVTAAYFAVKPGGVIIFASPCTEGLAHNHPRFADWLRLNYQAIINKIRNVTLEDKSIDLIAGMLAECNARAREKAAIFAISDGLADEDFTALGYQRFTNIQAALDESLRRNPQATIGLLPRGGDCLPILQ